MFVGREKELFFNGEPVGLPKVPHEAPFFMRLPVALLVLLFLVLFLVFVSLILFVVGPSLLLQPYRRTIDYYRPTGEVIKYLPHTRRTAFTRRTASSGFGRKLAVKPILLATWRQMNL